MYFDAFDEEVLKEYIISRINWQGESEIEMQFASREAFMQADTYLFAEEKIFDLIRSIGYMGAIATSTLKDKETGYMQIGIELDDN